MLRTNFNDTTEAPMGVEFMVGAISSGNYLDAMAEPPPPGLAAGADRGRQCGRRRPACRWTPLEQLVLKYNPHMTFWNGATWGYAILTVTPQQMICDYRVVSTVKQPTATLEQLASFTVPAGSASVTRTHVKGRSSFSEEKEAKRL